MIIIPIGYECHILIWRLLIYDKSNEWYKYYKLIEVVLHLLGGY